MKKNLNILIIILLQFVYTADKKYSIASVNITGQLKSDGSMLVTEERIYKFKGKFKYVYQDLIISDGILYDDITVSDEYQDYFLSDKKESGSFDIIKKDNYLQVRWNFKAKNESRTFKLKYRVNNVVKKYRDTAVIYYKFIGQKWKKTQSNITIQLIPPEKIDKFDIQAWIYGPLWAEYKIDNDGYIIARTDRLPRKTFFEIIALYSPEIFPQVSTIEEYVKSDIIKKQEKGVLEANRKRELAIEKEINRKERLKYAKWIVILFSLIGFLFWYLLYKKYGKRVILPYRQDMTSDVPDSLSPPLLQYLIGREIYGNAIIATIFDLARKKIILVKQNSIERKKYYFFGGPAFKEQYIWELDRDVWKIKKSNLLKYENELIVFIFDTLAKGGNFITLDKIKKSRSKFVKFFNNWKKDVKHIGIQKGWYDDKSFQGRNYSFIIAGLMAILNIPILIFFGPWVIISGGSTIIIFILSNFIVRRTMEGEMLYQKWNGLKKYLNKGHFKKLTNEESINNINDYLLYGIVLGVKSKITKEMIRMIPDNEMNDVFYWYGYQGHGHHAMDGFANSFNSMVSVTSSTMSTASGSGGGASSGGGGGAGGGGGGSG